jgi:uncharacterized repeat protein (TIGR01451 family)
MHIVKQSPAFSRRLVCSRMALGLGALLLAASPWTARAQATATADAPLAVQLTVKRVAVDAQGKESLVSAADAKPNDILEYVATYTNRGKKPLSAVTATLPIPTHTVYVGRTAQPGSALAATGDGKYRAEPLMRTVKGADGRERVEPVPLSEYRSLRWTLNAIAPAGSQTVTARVRVDSAAVVAVASAPKR